MAQLAGAVEYTDRIPAEWLNFSNKCPGYDTKQIDGEAFSNAAGSLGTVEYTFIAIASTLTQNGSA